MWPFIGDIRRLCFITGSSTHFADEDTELPTAGTVSNWDEAGPGGSAGMGDRRTSENVAGDSVGIDDDGGVIPLEVGAIRTNDCPTSSSPPTGVLKCARGVETGVLDKVRLVCRQSTWMELELNRKCNDLGLWRSH